MGKWKCEICNNEFDNFQAQGFNHQIYCPLCYFKELYKREKSKNNKAIEYIKDSSHKIEWGDIEQDNESIDINDDITETEFIESLLEILGGNNE